MSKSNLLTNHGYFVANVYVLLILMVSSTNLFAQTKSDSAPNINYDPEVFCKHLTDHPAECTERARFRGYEPNYFLYRYAKGDENAIRAHYSFRYVLTKPDCMTAYRHGLSSRKETRDCLENWHTHREVYLMYTGAFDFYMGTRTSGPVVNRISNPGIHYRQYVKYNSVPGLQWWDIGLEHKSDGQTVDARDTVNDPTSPNFGSYVAQVEYENGNHQYFDSISRDTNYVLGEVHYTYYPWAVWARLKFFYFSNDDKVTWGPYANTGIKMADFDLVRIVVSRKFEHVLDEVHAEWTVGLKGASTDSLNLGVAKTVHIFGLALPIYIQAHFGPLNTLSDYTRSQTMYGIGLRVDTDM